MSLSFIDRHYKLQQRLLREMSNANQASREKPAAESADRSSKARAEHMRNLRKEEEAQRSSGADGADGFSLIEIPEHLLLLFRKIPPSDGGTCPSYISLTPSEENLMGENMGLKADLWHLLVKSPVLSLPHTCLCKYWMDWACATHQLPEGAGCMLMNPNTYNADIHDPGTVTHHGPHTAAQQDVHIKSCGYPMAVWRWIIAPDYEGNTLDDGFQLIQPDAPASSSSGSK